MRAHAQPRRFIGTTLTGMDACTRVSDIQWLASQPNVELAFLFSQDSDGPRFVSEHWMRATLAQLTPRPRRLALHVCGPAARRMLMDGKLSSLVRLFSRVQVNGDVDASELPRLHRHTPHLITQHRPANFALAHAHLPRHSLLVDGSGGTGVLPTCWIRPLTAKAVGFAGGLRLGNLEKEFQRIAAVAHDDWWIDMESGLRSPGDQFDPQIAWDTLALVERLRSATEEQQA